MDNQLDNQSVSHQRTRIVYTANANRLELTWRPNIFTKSKYKLEVGDTIIGRRDKQQPSDIEVKDSYMSLRSAIIKTTCDAGSYYSQLILLRATNQTYYNGKPMNCGEAVYLNAGDTFQLGKTTFNVLKVN